jgi:hypothetical protein
MPIWDMIMCFLPGVREFSCEYVQLSLSTCWLYDMTSMCLTGRCVFARCGLLPRFRVARAIWQFCFIKTRSHRPESG